MGAKKRCSPKTGCGKLKDIETGFYPSKDGKVPPLCKECAKARRRAFYATHKEKENKAVMEYYNKNKKAIREYQKDYYLENAEKLKAKATKRYHAIKKTQRKVVAKKTTTKSA